MAQTSCKSLIYLMRLQILSIVPIGLATAPQVPCISCCCQADFCTVAINVLSVPRTCGVTFLRVVGRGLCAALTGARNLKEDTDRTAHTTATILGSFHHCLSVSNVLLHIFAFSSTKLVCFICAY